MDVRIYTYIYVGRRIEIHLDILVSRTDIQHYSFVISVSFYRFECVYIYIETTTGLWLLLQLELVFWQRPGHDIAIKR